MTRIVVVVGFTVMVVASSVAYRTTYLFQDAYDYVAVPYRNRGIAYPDLADRWKIASDRLAFTIIDAVQGMTTTTGIDPVIDACRTAAPQLHRIRREIDWTPLPPERNPAARDQFSDAVAKFEDAAHRCSTGDLSGFQRGPG